MKLPRVVWTGVAVAVAVAGCGGSLVAARAWRDSLDRSAAQEVERTASDVSGRATDNVRRAMDLALSFRGVLSTNPSLDDADFQRWISVLDPFRRNSGIIAFGYARAERGSELQAVPSRCPLQLVASTAAMRIPVGLDLCGPSTNLASSLGRATDTGELTMGVLAPQAGVRQPVLIGGAVYRESNPINVFSRRRQVAGWVGLLVDGDAVVRHGVAGHPEIWLEIAHQVVGGELDVIGASGRRPPRPALDKRRVFDADGRWSIRVAAPRSDAAISAAAQERAVGAVGTMGSLLLALLVLVLTSSRARLQGLVEARTGELLHQALHDPLTDLPNRALILDELDAIEEGREDPVAALFIDLDDFKDINDTIGHAAGDDLLRAVALRLRNALAVEDTVGRLGGDEFVVILRGEAAADGGAVMAHELAALLAEPYELEGGFHVVVHASVGTAAASRTGAELLQDADTALYVAKAAGRGRVVAFEPAMRQRAQERLDLEAALREAIRARQFFLVYQPTFDLQQMQVRGVEALLRWRHPDRGVMAPDAFIPLAEQTGLIVEVGEWVIHEACHQAATWHRAGHPLSMAVNVSARQLDDDRLIDVVEEALSRSGLAPSKLTIEITESALMGDVASSVRRVTALKELGLRVAIDDFGTGYSSLAYLQQFPVDQLKIDRSFVAAIGTSSEAATLLQTLVRLGRGLGLDTLAEGIEETGQCEHLRAEHCDLGQGFLFARPLVPEAIVPFLHRWSREAHDAGPQREPSSELAV